MIKKPFHELVHGTPQAHIDHLAFLEKRSARDAGRQVLLDESAETTQKRWEDKRKVAADVHSTETVRRKVKKTKHQQTVDERATERRGRQQQRFEEKEGAVRVAVEQGVKTKGERLHSHSAKLRDAHGRVLHEVKTDKLKRYDGGQDDVQQLIDKLHCFPQRKLDPIPGSSYNVSYNSSLTPRPPGAQKPMPKALMPPLPSYTSPTQASAQNAAARESGKGAVTQKAIDAAKQWVAFRRTFEASPYTEPVQPPIRPMPPSVQREASNQREASAQKEAQIPDKQ
eukprot:TRINITY_DN1306_c1_g2_i1.p1 TRINITY_DN1306_c1_g2~~TRINITY_DN1306_c1_g2_i1.p1  ORF type:complete len:283 (+),score=88.46 TRINITY_DN1306_c1_g2_i1:38-886(+)